MPDRPDVTGRPRATPKQVRRWGIRLVAFLVLGLLALLISAVQGFYTVLSFTMLLVGLGGAAVCTALGLKTLYEIPPDQRARGRPRDL